MFPSERNDLPFKDFRLVLNNKWTFLPGMSPGTINEVLCEFPEELPETQDREKRNLRFPRRRKHLIRLHFFLTKLLEFFQALQNFSFFKLAKVFELEVLIS